jgi:predicted  nucleic acid-binding Zn-ribbon protein
MGELEALLELQRLDQSHDELLARRRTLEAEGERLRAKLEEARAELDANRERVSALERDCRLRTLEVDQLDEQIREYQHRLDVDIMSYKDMESLREQILHQRGRMNRLEDEALTMMDAIEEEKLMLSQAETRHEEHTAELERAIDESATGVRDVDAALEENRGARQRCADQVPVHLLRRYDDLHRAHRDPIAPIRGGSCCGCSLKLSAGTVERARSGQEIVTCENCSRLLYIK